MATPSAKKVHAENLRQRAHKIAKFVADAEALAAKLAETTVKVAVKVSESGKIYGSVTSAQLAEALEAAGVQVDKKDITVADNAKELGVYEATVKCYKDVKGTFKYEIVAE
jgi:large subunit ribosomal protein L9